MAPFHSHPAFSESDDPQDPLSRRPRKTRPRAAGAAREAKLRKALGWIDFLSILQVRYVSRLSKHLLLGSIKLLRVLSTQDF